MPTTLENQFPEVVTAQPALMAQHSTEAGLSEKAVGYWLKAGQQAVARSAMTEAVAQLQKGLDLLTSMPDNSARQQQELDLRITLGQALIATKGWGSPLVGETYARARLLAEQLDRPDYLFPLLVRAICVPSPPRRTETGAISCAADGGDRADPRRCRHVADGDAHSTGVLRFIAGEFVAARTILAQSYAMSDPAARAAIRAACATVMPEDPHVADTRVSCREPRVPGLC